MPTSTPNQKWIQVHKPHSTSNFLMVDNDEWMQANKILTPYGLQLYLFLAANRDGYQFALSPEYAEQSVGIRRTTFYEYLRRLEIKGYLVWRHGNVYDFYTSPCPADKRTHPDRHSAAIEFDSAQETEISACEQSNPCCEQICSRSDIETDTKYINNTDTQTDNVGKPHTPAASAAVAADLPSIEERIINIKPPIRKQIGVKSRSKSVMDKDFIF